MISSNKTNKHVSFHQCCKMALGFEVTNSMATLSPFLQEICFAHQLTIWHAHKLHSIEAITYMIAGMFFHHHNHQQQHQQQQQHRQQRQQPQQQQQQPTINKNLSISNRITTPPSLTGATHWRNIWTSSFKVAKNLVLCHILTLRSACFAWRLKARTARIPNSRWGASFSARPPGMPRHCDLPLPLVGNPMGEATRWSYATCRFQTEKTDLTTLPPVRFGSLALEGPSLAMHTCLIHFVWSNVPPVPTPNDFMYFFIRIHSFRAKEASFFKDQTRQVPR